MERRPAAILAPDVVGYTRLMGVDSDNINIDIDEEVGKEPLKNISGTMRV